MAKVPAFETYESPEGGFDYLKWLRDAVFGPPDEAAIAGAAILQANGRIQDKGEDLSSDTAPVVKTADIVTSAIPTDPFLGSNGTF